MTTYTLAFIGSDGRKVVETKGYDVEWTSVPAGLWLRRAAHLRVWHPLGRIVALTEKLDSPEVDPEPDEKVPDHEVG